MKPLLIVFTTFCLLIASPRFASAQAKSTEIKPFVNEFTLAVGRVNLAGLDFAALDHWADDVMQQAASAAGDRAVATRQMHTAIAAARDWSAAFTKAGGKTVWMVFTIEDFPKGSPMFFVAPIEPGANVETLKQALATQGQATIQQIGSALVVAPDEPTIARIKAMQGQDRPELEKALSAPGEGDVVLALAASPDARKVLESMLPKLPDGKSATPLTRDLKWAGFAMKSTPNPGGQILLQASDEASAAKLKQSLISLLGSLANDQANRADAGGALLTLASELVKQSQVKGDQIAIDLQGGNATALAARMADGVAAARESARRMQTMNQIKQLMLACIEWANDNKQLQYPQTLEDAVKALNGGPQFLTNPRHPNDPSGFVFIRPSDGLKADAQRMVIYEKHDKWDGGIAAGFADGHVEFISDQAIFKKLLDEAQKKQAK